MTITKTVRMTVSCDDGAFCERGPGQRARITLACDSRGQAIALARRLGWVLRYSGALAQCPACRRHQRISWDALGDNDTGSLADDPEAHEDLPLTKLGWAESPPGVR